MLRDSLNTGGAHLASGYEVHSTLHFQHGQGDASSDYSRFAGSGRHN
jgi:hypothetical protein